jgi:hypothetical protein
MVYIVFYQHANFLDLINIYIRNNKKKIIRCLNTLMIFGSERNGYNSRFSLFIASYISIYYISNFIRL